MYLSQVKQNNQYYLILTNNELIVLPSLLRALFWSGKTETETEMTRVKKGKNAGEGKKSVNCSTVTPLLLLLGSGKERD